MWRNTAKLAELIGSLPVDLVHVRSRAPAWSARAAARRCFAPFVTTFHNPYKAHNWFRRFWAGPMAKADHVRSEEHTSELQSLMRISYAVFCLKTTTTNT